MACNRKKITLLLKTRARRMKENTAAARYPSIFKRGSKKARLGTNVVTPSISDERKDNMCTFGMLVCSPFQGSPTSSRRCNDRRTLQGPQDPNFQTSNVLLKSLLQISILDPIWPRAGVWCFRTPFPDNDLRIKYVLQ